MASLPVLATSMWASTRFALDTLHVSAAGRPLVDLVMIIAVAQTNVQLITARPEQQLTYATLEQLPPEHLRRPMSISALAAMLGLPFETVRRRVQRLVANGNCELTTDGLRIPMQVFTTEQHMRTMAAAYDLTRELYLRLRDCSCLETLQLPDGDRAAHAPPIRAVARLAYDHLLRLIEGAVSLAGDLRTTLLLLTIWRENVEHCHAAPALEDVFLADADRRPVSAVKLANRLGLSESTTYRRLRTAEQKGWCRISQRGVIVRSAFLSSNEFVQAMQLNHASLGRLFGSLSRLGVFEHWDDVERAAPRGQRRI
jgi:DNA-binding IclR family transcriptional regulator